jgi:hypothetical protein
MPYAMLVCSVHAAFQANPDIIKGTTLCLLKKNIIDSSITNENEKPSE